jgi:hypothetical protein
MRRASEITPSSDSVAERVSVRLASRADAGAVEWVAQRDATHPPQGPLVVAEVDGRILAARSLADGEVVADPFSRTAHLLEILELWAGRLEPRPVVRDHAGRRRLVPRRQQGYAHV